jgi:aldehyde dehydrogenase (NAD+)
MSASLKKFNIAPAASGLAVSSPYDSALLTTLPIDTAQSVDAKIIRAKKAQTLWAKKNRAAHAALLESLAGALKAEREAIGEVIHLEAGKTRKEALGETDGSADVILKTIKDATLPEFSGMLRTKERPAAGAVGLITSFNFPLVVANWTLAPALLAGNAVVWKPSEKTPLAALAMKAVFDTVAGEFSDLLQVIIGGREVGEALVAHEGIDLVSATGSVAMGKGIKATLSKKKNNRLRPILELGGNNGVIISGTMSTEHLKWSLDAIMNSFLGTTGQRCTNTRRLIVHSSHMAAVEKMLTENIETFLKANFSPSGFTPDNAYGYGPLIDADAFSRFEQAKQAASKEGGRIVMGRRLMETTAGYYVEPALAILPKQSDIMHQETFAPILFIAPYAGNIEDAISLQNAPSNAGLVAGIYTQSQREADIFAAHCEAGHALINSPKGTGTPAYGMGFGGNKDSGEGEILNSADPLAAFVRPDSFRRIAQNKDIAMNQ